MIISISGIDGSGKTSLIKALAKEVDFFIPNHVSTYTEFPKNLVQWYTQADIDEVVALDLKAFTIRNAAIEGTNVLLDRGYQNIIDSACARYQNRLCISYSDALERVTKLIKKIGFNKIEDKAILLDFPFDDWYKIYEILNEREGRLSVEYIGYLKILNQNMRDHFACYDNVLDATKTIKENLELVLVIYKKWISGA